MSSFRAFGLGAQGAKVTEIRSRLVSLGLLAAPSQNGAVRETPRFGAEDQTAVRAFQQLRGLTVDGIVGSETFRALEESRWRFGDRVLLHRPGQLMRGDDVAELQRRLLQLGFDCGKPDGVFGEQCAAALRDFQRNTGVAADGTCGPRTFQAFERLTRTVVGGRAHALRESARLYRNGHQHAGQLVVVDPGHGPSEPGVSVDGLTEAELIWDIGSRLEGRLSVMGMQVYLTRGRHGDPDDQARASFANDVDADLFVSLHIDEHANPAACGAATYYFGSPVTGEHSALGERFAQLVQRELVARTGLLDCRPHQKTWDLLRMTRMPAVRLEVGYLTCPGDRDLLGQAAFRDRVAEAIAAAVQRLFMPPDDDAPTGTLRIPADLRAGVGD